ncbi:hypothetical protein EKO04_008410 [Ascochyta lentis]|uniref:Uncharacterized protein n=1 Tax=Ascochyta lentis TaxID=205686 RepID=A0A8H7MHK4_9PLEO|nr:hypothetical protein EKO04_008410 [Ascochyta lentis]
MSSINNSHRIVSDATQEAFVLLSSDLEWLAMEFTSADELQAKAIKRRETQEMIIGIITSLVTMATMAAGGIAFWAEPIVGATSQFVNQAAQISKAASSLSKLSSYAQRVGSFANLPGEAGKHGMIGVLQGVNSLAGVASGAYLSTSGLYKEYLKTNFKHDEEQFDNLLKLLRHDITLMAEGAFTATAAEMWALSTGEMSSSQLSLVDLYKSGFYFDVPAEVLRIDVSYMTKMYWTAAVIGPLWKTENAYISESDALTNGNCSTDTRGPQETKVCLEERPDHVYHIYAVTNWNDDKIHTIPGIQHLDGDGFRGLTKEIIVRSSLFKDEIWRASLQLPGDPDMSAILLQPLLPAETFDGYTGASQIQSEGAFSGGTNVSSENVIKVLEHYGAIPGAISLPICRSWGGETISTVNTEKHRNAPCLCHPVRPSLASPWSSPDNWTLAYTDRRLRCMRTQRAWNSPNRSLIIWYDWQPGNFNAPALSTG